MDIHIIIRKNYYSRSLLDIIWKSPGYNFQLQVRDAPTLCLSYWTQLGHTTLLGLIIIQSIQIIPYQCYGMDR